MTENEKKFVRTVVDFAANLEKAQDYIKENFNIDSEFDEESGALKLSCSDANEALNLLSAKSYIEENLDNGLVKVIF